MVEMKKYESNYEFYKKYGFGGKLGNVNDNTDPNRAAKRVTKANAYKKMKRRKRYYNAVERNQKKRNAKTFEIFKREERAKHGYF